MEWGNSHANAGMLAAASRRIDHWPMTYLRKRISWEAHFPGRKIGVGDDGEAATFLILLREQP